MSIVKTAKIYNPSPDCGIGSTGVCMLCEHPVDQCQCGSPHETVTNVTSAPSLEEQGVDPDGHKHDLNKPKWYLLPWKVIEGVVNVMTFGANKYSENGWQKIPQAEERYFAALMRHKMKMDAGVYLDPESGLPHWAHFCCNAVFLGYFYLNNKK